MTVRTEAKGMNRVRAMMRKFPKKVANDALGKALYEEATNVKAEAMLIVPFDLGNLASTGTVTKPSTATEGLPTGQVSVSVRFGGSRAPYAVIQHEDLTLNHTAPRTAKYLETPAMEATAGMARRVANRIKRIVNSASPGV